MEERQPVPTPTRQKPSVPDLIPPPPRLYLLSILHTMREGCHLLHRIIIRVNLIQSSYT